MCEGGPVRERGCKYCHVCRIGCAEKCSERVPDILVIVTTEKHFTSVCMCVRERETVRMCVCESLCVRECACIAISVE